MRKFFNSLAIFVLLIGFSGCFGPELDVTFDCNRKPFNARKGLAWPDVDLARPNVHLVRAWQGLTR